MADDYSRIRLGELCQREPDAMALVRSARGHSEVAREVNRMYRDRGFETTERTVRRYRGAMIVDGKRSAWVRPTIADIAEDNPQVRAIIDGPVASTRAAKAISDLGYSVKSAWIRKIRAERSTAQSPDGELSEEARLLESLAQSRARERDLARQLHEVKHKHQDYLDTLWRAVTDTVQAQVIPPVRPPSVRGVKASGPPEVAVVMLSDLQTGKVTPTYNSEVCAARVDRYASKIIELTQLQETHHPVRECVVHALGDMVEGADIFPGQQWLIDSTLYTQLLDTTPVIIASFVRKLLTYFDKVTVRCVDGNHGRIGRRGQFGPMDNVDRMVYRVVSLMLRDEPRCTIEMTDPAGERNWYQISTIGNYSALLIHGDQIRGHSGLPWYGFQKRINSWGSGGLDLDDRGFKDVHMGHWHQLAMIPLNAKKVWVNGSTESTNTYAAETLAAQSLPTQWLLYVSPEKGRVTASYAVSLD